MKGLYLQVVFLLMAGVAIGARAEKRLVAVIGAGPAGVSAAYRLAEQGAHVVVFDKETTFGGGILNSYYWRKNGRKIRKLREYAELLDRPNIDYVGGVPIGENGTFRRQDLIEMGFDGIVYAVGATRDNALGIPGEELAIPTSHASNHYNEPWTGKKSPPPPIGERVAVIGAGASAGDVSRFVLEDHPWVKDFTLLIRRSPVDGLKRMTYRHFSIFYNFLRMNDFEDEVKRHRALFEQWDTTPEAFLTENLAAAKGDQHPGGLAIVGKRAEKVNIRFLWNPIRIEKKGDGSGTLILTAEENKPVYYGEGEGDYLLEGTGITHSIEVDTVLSIIGMHVNPAGLELPAQDGRFRVTADAGGSRPVDRYLADVHEAVPSFVFGWAQRPQGSDRDHEARAENFARLVMANLAEKGPPSHSVESRNAIRARVATRARQAGREVALRLPGIPGTDLDCRRMMAGVIAIAEAKIRRIEAAMRR